MDVHAPHEPIRTWRDIALHLGIVTVGLFIALSLEAFVEHLHNRHLVAEARANIREELQINHDAAQKNIGLVQQNIDTIKANIDTIHLLQTHPKDFHGSITNSMSFDSLNDAAWRTARDTGALSFMPYKEIQRYSDLYMLEALVNQKAITAGEQSFSASIPTLMGYDIDKIPADEYTQMLRDNAATAIDLLTLKQFLIQLDQAYVDELKH
ncbi:hypothetical protein [Granulicella sp. L46]|jgi:hypothetical protein|uniref:hypothetical protein n=1 Tax=Granulicella sp. L46 TaxID=1641865 RepID=UPI00131B7F4A|nr:hypothetical protein [Granulicella sp. L46]